MIRGDSRMNANSLIERLTSMALAMPTGKSEASSTAQKAASAVDAPYARELRKSLEKSDNAKASTTEANDQPKASDQAEETPSRTPARHDELTPRHEGSLKIKHIKQGSMSVHLLLRS